MDTNDYVRLLSDLKNGNDLCSTGFMGSSYYTDIRRLYKSIAEDYKVYPLISAAFGGFHHLLWGFIECAKATNTDLHTDQTLDLQKFLGYSDSNGYTALHMAAWHGRLEVVKILLQYVSVQHLTSCRSKLGYAPINWLKDPAYDYYIFEYFKAAAGGQKVDPGAAKYQDHYEELEMAASSYPTSHKNTTQFALHNLNNGKCELTPNKNTILHLVSKFGDLDYAKSILEKHPSLIHCRNTEGETPLYVAAREGHIDILEILINCVQNDELKLELAIRTKDKHTALHIAIENHHAGVVFLLVKEIPKLGNCTNSFNESPLYFAVEKGYYHIFRLLLDKCSVKAFEGANGGTALHAAAFLQASAFIQDLLRENIGLLRIHSNPGWTPLHYVVSYNKLIATNELLKADPNIGYQMTKTSGRNDSAIHIAVSKGLHDQIHVLVSNCPGCLEMTDTEGRNVLHVAIAEKRIDTFYFILDRYKSVITTDLINQRDNNGNTPFHLLAASDYEANLMAIDYRANLYARNNQFLTPIDMASSEEKRLKYIKAKEEADKGQEEIKKLQSEEEERKRKEEERIRKVQEEVEEKEKQTFTKIGDNIVLVVTLIATATFAAAFTVPGGFDGNEDSSQGMPILIRKALYKAFVVSNALAFSCSCCVLFGYVRLQLYDLFYEELDKDERKGYFHIINLQYLLIGIAMVAMAVAFITGTYVILTPSLALAISLCATCVCIIVPFSLFPAKYLGFATRFIFMFAKSFNNVSS